MILKEQQTIIGVDSGDYESVVYWRDQDRYEHISHEPGQLTEWLTSVAKTNSVLVSECASGALVRAAVSHGVLARATTPLQANRGRQLLHRSGKKDDKTDARVHAELYASHSDLFHDVTDDDEIIETIRYVIGQRERLVDEATAQSNQLREQLKEAFPALVMLEYKYKTQWLLEMLIQAPTAGDFRRYKNKKGIERLAGKMDIPEDEVCSRMSAVARPLPARKKELMGEVISSLATTLLKNIREAARLEREVAELIEELDSSLRERDGDSEHSVIEVLNSFPMMGPVTLGRLIAEYPEIVYGTGDKRELSIYAGAVPVTKQSGGKRTVIMRYSRNVKLQTALKLLAKNAKRKDDKFKRLYARERAKGKREFAALRGMLRPMINIIYAMVRDRTLYKPEATNAEQTAA